MVKIGPGFDPNGYAPVAERVRLFYVSHPLGRIETNMVDRTDKEIVFKASVYRQPNDTLPAATGWAAERIGDGEINMVACLENTETSAVGRALANLGFTGSRQRPSAEEMAKASHYRARLSLERSESSATAIAVREPTATESDVEGSTPAGRAPGVSSLRRDVLALIGRAAPLGIRPARVDRWRLALNADAVPIADLVRWERRLRLWIERHQNLALM